MFAYLFWRWHATFLVGQMKPYLVPRWYHDLVGCWDVLYLLAFFHAFDTLFYSVFFQNNLGFQLEYSSISLSLFLKKRLFYVLYATTVLYFIQKIFLWEKLYTVILGLTQNSVFLILLFIFLSIIFLWLYTEWKEVRQNFTDLKIYN